MTKELTEVFVFLLSSPLAVSKYQLRQRTLHACHGQEDQRSNKSHAALSSGRRTYVPLHRAYGRTYNKTGMRTASAHRWRARTQCLGITTGISSFAVCLRHTAKANLHSANALPSVTLGKERSVNCTSATASLPSTICRALGKEKSPSRRQVTVTDPLPSAVCGTRQRGQCCRVFAREANVAECLLERSMLPILCQVTETGGKEVYVFGRRRLARRRKTWRKEEVKKGNGKSQRAKATCPCMRNCRPVLSLPRAAVTSSCPQS
jgi:hypothetical protein